MAEAGVFIGVDAHKEVHAAVAVDAQGRELDHWRGANSIEGWLSVLGWAQQFGPLRLWGIEGAGSFGRNLAQYLVTAGERVAEINARWTAAERRHSRQREKTDRLDARAVARILLREAERLPWLQPEDHTALLALLTRERDTAHGEATRVRNQLHALLLQLDPQYKRQIRSLTSRRGLAAAEHYATPHQSPWALALTSRVHTLARRLRGLMEDALDLQRQLEALATVYCAPLTQICGVNLLTAGVLAGLLGPAHRFETDAQLAAFAGVAPLEASSASQVRHRLNRGGNRRLNSVLYLILVCQSRFSEQARTYIARRLSEGKSKKEAFRALKRHLIRTIWRLWKQCSSSSQPASSQA
jgi:transposase